MLHRLVVGNEKGVAAVEFAIVGVVFLIPLVFGLIEFSFLVFNRQVLVNAGREGVRAGIIGYGPDRKTDPEIGQIVTDYCRDNSPTWILLTFDHQGDDPVTTVTPAYAARGWCGSGVSRGDDLTVRVDYDYYFQLPALLGFGPTTTLSTSTTMKMESDDCPPP
jgi:Flp pilus assembly protein TadG